MTHGRCQFEGFPALDSFASSRDKWTSSTVIFLLTIVNANPTTPNIMGLTPLHLASMDGHFATIKTLLDHGNVDPYATDNEGRTPGDLALEKLDEETISKLDPRLFGSSRGIIDVSSAEVQTC
ncbi:hypothetical protein N7527_011889 [Penicillium freii]|nr:hypothetical protein N7527_011889 [Penicillium freii]